MKRAGVFLLMSFFATNTFAAIAAGAFAAKDPVLLKNFREIYASYVNITGVNGRDKDIADVYRLVVDRLPKAGTPDELSSAVILAATEVSGMFCKKAIDSEKAVSHGERILFGDIDFARGPSQFTDYLKSVVNDHLALAFWQRNANAAEKQALSKVITDASKGSAETGAETEKVMHVLCTAYATSLAFLAK